MNKIFSFFLFTLLGSTLYAKTITSIEYEGMVHISESVAVRMLPFKKGDQLDEKKVNTAIVKYFKQGYFEDIQVTFDEGKLKFIFVEKAIISKIEMKGYKEDDEEAQNELLQIKKGSLYDEKRIEKAKKHIIDALSLEGKIDTIVEVESKKLDNGSIFLTFIVNEGEKIVIKEMDYSGTKGLDPEEFDTVIANKAHEFMGWFYGRNDGEMKLPELQYDPLRIKDYYMQHGYLDAKIDQPFVRVDFDDYSAKMSYQIFEGEVYRVSDINIYQQHKVVTDATLEKVIGLKRNEAFNIKTFRDDSDRIKTKIADMGYAFVQVAPDLQKDKEKHTVNVIYRISPGHKVHIRNVIIAGNNRTLDRVIRRELYLAPGDLYSLTDLRDSKNSLGRTGFFESTTIEEKRIDENTMDLVVKVKEAPTGNIQLGGGYGSFGGLLLSVSVSDRNLFGSGLNVGLRLEKSERTENYSFNIANSRLNDSDFSGNFSIYKSKYQYNDYSVATDGISFGTGHRFTRHITGYLGYGYSNTDYLDIGQTGQFIDPRFIESYSKSSITVSANYDDTDDYYLPRIGMSMSQSFEKAGIGAEADFFKSRTTFNKYKGLKPYIGWDVIFRYKARYNLAAETGYLPLAERFYMGGIGSVRGYQSYSLAPYYYDTNGVQRRIGGKQTFSNNVELSFPFVPSAKMRLTAFYDWGWISGDLPESTGPANSPQAAVNNQELIRSGYGVSLEWFSPVGPIQLVFADAINPQPGDRTSNFEFSMGQRF